MAINLIHATAETFTEYVGDSFTVQIEGQAMTLKLDTIELLGTKSVREKHLEIDETAYSPRPPFALIFEGPREPILASNTYKFSHETIGDVELFISGFKQDSECMLYESCFN